MGDIADMMLDGTLCSKCGGYIGSDDGIPADCGCENDDLENDYVALNNEKKVRHAQWKIINIKAINKSGIPYRMAGGETLLFRQPGKPKVDYYPSTGRYRVCGQPAKSGGAKAKVFLEWYATATE